MRRWFTILTVSAALGWLAYAAHHVAAYPTASMQTKAACIACHTNPAGGPTVSDAGKAWLADNTKAPKSDAKGASYLSTSNCKMCHAKINTSWEATPHAKALETLQKADAKRVAEVAAKLKVEVKGAAAEDKNCLKCHVVGHGLDGGYPGADEKKKAALSAVGCESCHGPGGLHMASKADQKAATINKSVTEKMCRNCHTPEMSPNFKFDEYKAKGVHAIAK